MAREHKYEYRCAGIDYDGWFRVELIRDDGQTVKVTRKRYAELVREGRIKGANK